MKNKNNIKELTQPAKDLLSTVQVNIPFAMLFDDYLDRFGEYRLNPEIGIDAEALERFEYSDFRNVAQKLQEYQPAITLHGPYIDLSAGSPDPAVRAVARRRFEQLLELASVFKPRSVVCHAGYDWRRYGSFREEWLESSLDIWAWLAEGLLGQGARLMLENVYEDGPKEMRPILDRLKDQRVGFCLDAGHLFAFGNADLHLWLAELDTYIGQLHLHDNHGSGDDHLPLGKGRIDFKLLFAHLKSKGLPRPIITLEPHREADLWPSLEYLSQIWPW